VAKVRELLEVLKQLDPDFDIYVAIASEGGELVIEPVTESCADDTVIGYVITDGKSEDSIH
jgi:virulence-associated protein VagC